MTTVEIIDRSPIFAQGLVRILERNDLRTLSSGNSLAAPSPAEVLIVEAALWATGDADRATVRVPVLLTVADLDDSTADHYLQSGARGVIDRCADADILVNAVRAVARGCRFRGTGATTPEPAADGAKPPMSLLSQREQQVIKLIALGMTHGQIARRLGLSPHTVDTYVRRVRAKLDLGNKAELTRAALQSA